MNVSMGSGRIVNISPLRRRSPPGWPATSNVICQTRTRNAAGADATVHISDLLAGRASRPGERHARPDTPQASIGRRTGRISADAAALRRHNGGRGAAPDRPDQDAAAVSPFSAKSSVATYAYHHLEADRRVQL